MNSYPHVNMAETCMITYYLLFIESPVPDLTAHSANWMDFVFKQDYI